VAAAQDELVRHVKHRSRVAALHVEQGVAKKTLACAQCGTETPHAVEIDQNGETVAHCLCGRFRKFEKGAEVK
jgi:predicted aldo/keto reductase-like oxidoreductase